MPTVHDAAVDDALPDRHHTTIPTVDISGATNADDPKRHVVVAAGSEGKNWQHPHMLLPDSKTIFAVWTLGHGGSRGPMKRSDDGGLTWAEPLEVPDNWTSVRNCPTIHRLVDPQGRARLVVFARARDGSFCRSRTPVRIDPRRADLEQAEAGDRHEQVPGRVCLRTGGDPLTGRQALADADAGEPLVHSKDLVHWRYLGHAFGSNPHLRTGVTSGGVYGLEIGCNPHTRTFLIYAPLANREPYV